MAVQEMFLKTTFGDRFRLIKTKTLKLTNYEQSVFVSVLNVKFKLNQFVFVADFFQNVYWFISDGFTYVYKIICLMMNN